MQPKITSDRVLGVLLTHPDKLLWPDDGRGEPVVKLDLARYFEAVGPWMAPHLFARPCSILRAPNDVGAKTFLQRHAPAEAWRHVSEVRTDAAAPYFQVDAPEGLIELAQADALELHPWNCRAGDREIPGRLVFDLDPGPDAPFDWVIEAALDLRARLRRAGLEGFCKTTGGKGLHVVAPLMAADAPTWPQAKAFSRDLCRSMAGDRSDRHTLKFSKVGRSSLILLDYLRNDRVATAVAPLSPRARDGAPVSMPLTWEQVRPGLDPKAFTVRTAPAALKRSRAWDDYVRSEGSLRAAIARSGS